MSDESKNAVISLVTGGPGGAAIGFLLWPLLKTSCRNAFTGEYNIDCVPIAGQEIYSPLAMGAVGTLIGFVIAFVISEGLTSD